MLPILERVDIVPISLACFSFIGLTILLAGTGDSVLGGSWEVGAVTEGIDGLLKSDSKL
jgi:hypothetical protein